MIKIGGLASPYDLGYRLVWASSEVGVWCGLDRGDVFHVYDFLIGFESQYWRETKIGGNAV